MSEEDTQKEKIQKKVHIKICVKKANKNKQNVLKKTGKIGPPMC